jgi:ribosomal protein S18 acetylase RimI-like enzyme
MIRPVTLSEIPRLADFLDRRTLANRWLVAFFRHFPEIPPESAPYWGLWTETGGSGNDPASPCTALLAHHFRTSASYVVLDEGFDSKGIEALLGEEVLPEMLIGDGPEIREWESRSPEFFARAVGREELAVLEFRAPQSVIAQPGCPGFRPARGADEPLLREFEALYARELGEEEVESDIGSLIARELSFVIEEDGQVAGTMRSNLSDGRYVHVGGLYIHPRFRGRGLGTRLLAGLCERIQRSEAVSVILTADRANRPAMAVYDSVGFREIGSGLLLRFTEDAWRRHG